MKPLCISPYVHRRMSQRSIRISEIKQVMYAKGGYIEVPSKDGDGRRKRWMMIGKRKITVIFIETKNVFQLVTVYDGNEA